MADTSAIQGNNDSSFFTRLSKRGQGESFLVPPRSAQEEQARQLQKVHEAEIEELKQSLRYIEIQLARSKEEIETLNNKVHDQQNEIEKGHDNLAKQLKINQQQARQIADLQATIEGFNQGQRDLLEKNRFKASSYMTEINQREEELGRIRAQLLSNQDEMKLLTVSREQFRQQSEKMSEMIRERDRELERLRSKVEEQNRLVDSMVLAQKNLSDLEEHGEAMDRARDDIERAERIARSTTKSSFMALGETQPKLISEEQVSFNGKRGSPARSGFTGIGDDTYLNDSSVPAEVFQIIQQYREKLQRIRSGQNQSLLLDDFFAEIHGILKDQQMRELARVRNEHSVEIMKLRKTLESKLRQSDIGYSSKAKENFNAHKALGDKHQGDNELERQRRAMIEENEVLKKRLRGLETIVQSGSTEKTKFMEGASWIAKKAHIETEKHIQKLQNMLGEYQRKSKECIIDESITEVDGKKMVRVSQWLGESMEKEIVEIGERFESMFENVNYHLKEATKTFHKYK